MTPATVRLLQALILLSALALCFGQATPDTLSSWFALVEQESSFAAEQNSGRLEKIFNTFETAPDQDAAITFCIGELKSPNQERRNLALFLLLAVRLTGNLERGALLNSRAADILQNLTGKDDDFDETILRIVMAGAAPASAVDIFTNGLKSRKRGIQDVSLTALIKISPESPIAADAVYSYFLSLAMDMDRLTNAVQRIPHLPGSKHDPRLADLLSTRFANADAQQIQTLCGAFAKFGQARQAAIPALQSVLASPASLDATRSAAQACIVNLEAMQRRKNP